MAEAPDTLVVIPCLNEAAHIGDLLRRLAADPGCRRALIVVADGGSSDGTQAIVREWAQRDARIRLLDNPRRIQSAAMNLAVRNLGEGLDVLVRVDAHCRYPDAYVETVVAALRRSGGQSVVVPMVTEGRRCFQKAVAAAQNSRLGAGGSAHRIGGESGFIDHGHHAAWLISAYRAVGGYDEAFSHNEDAELDARLIASGARIWFAADAPIVYFPRSSPGPLFRQYLAYGRGRAMTVQRHSTRLKPRQLLPLLVAPACLASLAGPIFWPAAVPAAGWAAVCILYGIALSLRTRSACAAASGPAAMIMHLAWSLGFIRQIVLGPRPSRFSSR